MSTKYLFAQPSFRFGKRWPSRNAWAGLDLHLSSKFTETTLAEADGILRVD